MAKPTKWSWRRYSGHMHACMLLLQSYPTLCNPMNYNLPGSSVHGIFQARILKRVAMPFSRGSSWSRDQTHTSCVSCTAGNPQSLLLSHQGSPVQGIYKALKTKLPETLCKNLLNWRLLTFERKYLSQKDQWLWNRQMWATTQLRKFGETFLSSVFLSVMRRW